MNLHGIIGCLSACLKGASAAGDIPADAGALFWYASANSPYFIQV